MKKRRGNKDKKKEGESLRDVYERVSKEVDIYGAKLLNGKKRREWEADYLKSKGVKPKKVNVPYKILKRQRAKQARKKGALPDDINPLNAIFKKSGDKKRKNNSDGISDVLPAKNGRIRKGVLHYSSKDIEQVSRKK
eukprot:TRINITY_DN5897_c0_g1_i1.p1 TRINITY_DN5897_c0_g1~~TRINITY_DN5897_c0_g1_i1.p1  ORF type:complete len:137 (+),score=9.55 TRINITY_DN5897_c0_g1_i1:48-458(+)